MLTRITSAMEKKLDLRIVKTYSKLREALSQMMHEMKFDEITVYDLCLRAKIRRATFYKHFSDKYDFLSSVISTMQDEISDKLEKIEVCESPIDYYTLYVKEILDYLKTNTRLYELIMVSEEFPSILNVIMKGTRSSFIRDLKRDARNGLKLPSDVETVAMFLNGGLCALVVDWLQNGSVDEEGLLLRVKRLIERVLGF